VTYGFDLDGTITSHPAAFAALMESLVKQGHVVLVISGALSHMPLTKEDKTDQMRMLSAKIEPMIHYHDLIVPTEKTVEEVAKAKGRICRELAVDLMFEDDLDYIRWIKRYSPLTACVQVRA